MIELFDEIQFQYNQEVITARVMEIDYGEGERGVKYIIGIRVEWPDPLDTLKKAPEPSSIWIPTSSVLREEFQEILL